jgi:hypothetical protein
VVLRSVLVCCLLTCNGSARTVLFTELQLRLSRFSLQIQFVLGICSSDLAHVAVFLIHCGCDGGCDGGCHSVMGAVMGGPDDFVLGH